MPPGNKSLLLLKHVDDVTPCTCLQLFPWATLLFWWHLNSSFRQSFDLELPWPFNLPGALSYCLMMPCPHSISVSVCQEKPLLAQFLGLSLAAPLRRFATYEMHSGLRITCTIKDLQTVCNTFKLQADVFQWTMLLAPLCRYMRNDDSVNSNFWVLVVEISVAAWVLR
jgi:hypothetical protein